MLSRSHRPGASRPDPGPRSIPIRSGRSARTSHNPRERLPRVRSRGLPGDLAGQATISRRAVRAVRLPRGSSPTARTRGAAGSVPPDLVREADAEDGVGEVIPIRCPTSSVRPTRTSAPTPGRGPARARRRGPALTVRPTRVIMAAPGSRPPSTPGLPGPGWRDPKPGWAGVGLRNSDSLLNEVLGPGPVRTGPGLRNASSARRGPSRLAPCEPSATESACARSARAHPAQCDPR